LILTGIILGKGTSMSHSLKSGRELLDEFFSDIETLKTPDKEVVQSIIKLYKEDKLTTTNLSNELDRLKDKKLYGKD